MQAAITICKNCQHQFQGKFCNHCGEKVYTDHDKSFKHLLEEYFHFITHFEGKFLTTLITLIKYPGRFSFDYCLGIRKKYYPPLSLFLLLVIIYLVFPVFKGLIMQLDDHLTHGLYGDYASDKVTYVMHTRQWTTEIMTEKFQAVSEKVSKFLLFIIIPVMAFFNALLFYKQRKPLFDHFIFSTEINAFFLLWGFLILPPLFLLLSKLFIPIGLGFLFADEFLLGVLLIVPFLIYLRFAFIRFYWHTETSSRKKKNFQQRVKPWAFAMLFTIFHIAFMLTIYKILLFAISMAIIA